MGKLRAVLPAGPATSQRPLSSCPSQTPLTALIRADELLSAGASTFQAGTINTPYETSGSFSTASSFITLVSLPMKYNFIYSNKAKIGYQVIKYNLVP